jgi:hypothetical protein
MVFSDAVTDHPHRALACVMVKPPPMLTAEATIAPAASVWAGVLGSRPPPASTMPPTAVRPEMALVTDMRGECRAGVTPHTVW